MTRRPMQLPSLLLIAAGGLALFALVGVVGSAMAPTVATAHPQTLTGAIPGGTTLSTKPLRAVLSASESRTINVVPRATTVRTRTITAVRTVTVAGPTATVTATRTATATVTAVQTATTTVTATATQTVTATATTTETAVPTP